MPNYVPLGNVALPIERNDARQWDISPGDLGMDDVDLDITAALAATSPFLDLRNFFNYKLIVDVTASAMTLGAFKITLEEFNSADVVANGTAATVVTSTDLITGIDTTQNGHLRVAAIS